MIEQIDTNCIHCLEDYKCDYDYVLCDSTICGCIDYGSKENVFNKYYKEGEIEMIREDYVSFEVAELLKNKGFDEPTLYHYCQNNNFPTHTIDYEYIKNSEDAQFCSAPTLQMAMKWLREVYRIETHIALSELNADNSRTYMFDIFSSDMNRDFDSIQEYGFNSYEEACEAAIKFCLKNLI